MVIRTIIIVKFCLSDRIFEPSLDPYIRLQIPSPPGDSAQRSRRGYWSDHGPLKTGRGIRRSPTSHLDTANPITRNRWRSQSIIRVPERKPKVFCNKTLGSTLWVGRAHRRVDVPCSWGAEQSLLSGLVALRTSRSPPIKGPLQGEVPRYSEKNELNVLRKDALNRFI